MAGFWHSFFDFNGDGTTDPGEEWIAFKMFEECAKDDEGKDIDDPFEWRIYCEDGSEYGVSPYDYSSEYEYDEALRQAKEDYETEEEYNFAVEECEDNWRQNLSDEIRAKMEEAFVDPDEFFGEAELLEFLRRFDEASKRTSETMPSNPDTDANTTLEEGLGTGDKTKVLEALRASLRTNAELTIPVEISMDSADGAGDKCVYVVVSEKQKGGRWALAFTSEETTANDKSGAGVHITCSQECLLRSWC